MVQNKSNAKRLNLRSEEIQEILTKPPTWIVRWGISMVFMLTAIVLILSFIIKYPDFVTAKILVTTERPTEKIVARVSGAIDELFIQNGDSVIDGNRLAVIRNTAVTNDIYFLKSILDTLSLNTNFSKLPELTKSDLTLGEVESSYIDFQKNYIEYSLLKELRPHTNRLHASLSSSTELKIRLQNLSKKKRILDEEYRLRTKEFDRHKTLFEKGVISLQMFESKRLELLQIEKDLNSLVASASQIRESISDTEQAYVDIKTNQKEDDTRFLANLKQAQNSLKKSLNDWEQKYVLSSSTNGVVSFQEFWGVNQFVNTNEIVFSILPLEKSSLVGKLVIPSQNAGKVTLGQKVLIKLDNFPYEQFGTLIGRVKNISISPDKEGNYFVYVFLPNGTITSYNKKLPLDQELIGNAEIITEDLSVAARIFYKFRNLFGYQTNY